MTGKGQKLSADSSPGSASWWSGQLCCYGARLSAVLELEPPAEKQRCPLVPAPNCKGLCVLFGTVPTAGPRLLWYPWWIKNCKIKGQLSFIFHIYIYTHTQYIKRKQFANLQPNKTVYIHTHAHTHTRRYTYTPQSSSQAHFSSPSTILPLEPWC